MNKKLNIFQDWTESNSLKGKVICILYRTAHLATVNKVVFLILLPYLAFYKIMVEWVLGIEVPYNVRIGSGLNLFHGQALVVNKDVIIGDNCTIRHCTTIGNLDAARLVCPKIGNNVEIGANVCIIGAINIGDNVKIGAGSIVVKDIPSNSIAVGNPARIVKVL